MFEAESCAVAVVDDDDLSAAGKLAASLDRAAFWRIADSARVGRAPDQVRIVVKPELSGFAADTPTITSPALVEHLIDLLHDRGFTNVAVVGTADSSTLWAENRDLHALSDLLGYRYVTGRDRVYDIVDLADERDHAAFPLGCVLHGCGLSRWWLAADLRIVFGKQRTDEASGYALCLDTLIGVLPLLDKDLHYRRRRHPGDVVAALLDAAPVEFCLIDAIVGAHGEGGRRAPAAIDTNAIIAATDLVLADYVGALKMGLDPEVSPIFARVLRTHRLPQRYAVNGSLAPFRGWRNVGSLVSQTTRMRSRSEGLDRLIEPWLQRLDPELFPLKHPLDARLNPVVAEFLAGADGSVLAAINGVIAWIGDAIEAYGTMFDKDALRRQAVPLGIDLEAIPAQAFDALVEELSMLEPLAGSAPQASAELRWRHSGEAVIFRYSRELPIEFDLFTLRVDVARTIQFMNDYLGGVVVPLEHDEAGRPVRQAERNIYLPQPNYLVLYQGKPIDVSKLEVVRYHADHHRLYWKTLLSENGSAVFDDGIAGFERTRNGTRVTIVGRQQFTLPPFWQVFDPKLVPGLKSRLVTHAYQTFFDRTIANFEALVEGRDIRIGRPVDEPAAAAAEELVPLLQQIGAAVLPMLQQLASKAERPPVDDDRRIDPDGFVHIVPMPSNAGEPAAIPQQWMAEITRFIDGWTQAAHRDLLPHRGAA